LAGRILTEAFPALASQRHSLLERRFRTDRSSLEAALREIRRLDPCPGRALEAHTPEYVLPDLVVREVEDRLEVHPAEGCSPRLRIHARYLRLAGRAEEPGVAEFLRGRLRSARWLVHTLDRRRLTMIRVTQAIVAAQEAFFTEGPHALRPLTLREIAGEVGLHESTVARVTKDKYLETPRGIFPLKFFFSSRISTESGRDTSARAVKARIRVLVEGERHDRPLSDEAIVRCLEGEGIRIARRTVAKYRDQMRIARARFRKRTAGRVPNLRSGG
jgi:RNA polymerase sigma-54 factor